MYSISMRKITFGALVISAIIVAACQSSPTSDTGIASSSQVSSFSNGSSNSSSVHAASWKTYTNSLLGFSIRYPESIYVSPTDCSDPSATMALLVVSDDPQRDQIYIAPDYTISGSDCKKQQVTINDLNGSQKKPIALPFWRLRVVRIADEAALRYFIGKEFGSSCTIGKKTPSQQAGVFDVEIKGDGKPLSETKCPVMVKEVLKYYPATQSLAFWSMGEEPTFIGDAQGTIIYDFDMEKSFQFIQK